MDVAAINMDERQILLDDGRVFPITNLLDGDGDETTDPADAVALVAGAELTWITVCLHDYEPVVIQ